ncbi:MAG: cobyrinate a,c-diamide synthase [Oscillospiraceae bacterium]|nr:cobyrinate a,c-diamide synthase [Oscillospiraceae bacterium]
MRQIMLSAMHSGAGKTVTTCALLAALKKREESVFAFKCGPDYIDPMFHTKVLGIPSRNLDLFLQGQEGVRQSLLTARDGIAVLEGAMGYYDGLAGTEKASAWEIACVTDTPVLLVLRPKGAGVSLAAQVKGLLEFRPDSHIVGLLLADCREALSAYLKPILERETGLPVLGYLPPMEEASFGSRHLGLLTPDEIRDLTERFDRMAEQVEKSIDLDALMALAHERETPPVVYKTPLRRCRIAVARDEAFCFYYEDSFDRLRAAGGELVFFSPLHDEALPSAVDGLYLGGGYPELYARQLSQNESMLRSVRNAVENRLPTVAECGGFLYLQRTLEDSEGKAWPMCGCLPGDGFRTGRLQRFGYLTLEAAADSLLLRKGESLPAHEFHHWDCTVNGEQLLCKKADGRQWRCGFVSDSLYAAFPHLHLGGELPLAERFVEACAKGKDHGTV